VVVEDAPAGIASGRAAGCRVLGVLGTHEAVELQEATWLVDGLAAVRAERIGNDLRLEFMIAT